MVLLIIYILMLLLLSLYDRRRVKTFDDFVRAGKKASVFMVTTSLLASIMGASATLGVISQSMKIGFPAFWWLGSGALGLIASAFLLVKPLARRNVYSLPELLEDSYGGKIRQLVAFIVSIGWLGVVGAQYTACGKMVALLSGIDFTYGLILSGVIIAAYCALGGQLTVLRTDILQFLIIFVAILSCIFILYGRWPVEFRSEDFLLLNENFGFDSFLYYSIIIGSGYFVGPDIFSRLYTAKNERVMRVSLISAAAILLFFSFCITMIGLWMKYTHFDPQGEEPLLALIREKLPFPIQIFLMFGLLSAVISSADTCLVTVSAVIENDILRRKSIKETRLLTFGVGLLALLPALWQGEIIPLLLLSYNVFNAGVIPPVAVALIFSRRRIQPLLIVVAMVGGGSLGLISSLLEIKALALVGFLFSSLCSILAVIVGKSKIS